MLKITIERFEPVADERGYQSETNKITLFEMVTEYDIRQEVIAAIVNAEPKKK